jgi:hypothetical protein
MPQLIFQNSLAWLILGLVAALLAAAWHYFRPNKFTKMQAFTMASLRFLVFFVLAVLLVGPMLSTTLSREEKPILIWLQDNSESMVSMADSSAVRDFANTTFKEWEPELIEKYQIEKYTFSSGLKADGASDFIGEISNLGEALQGANGRFYGQNVGAAVLFSDGLFNQGANPVSIAPSIAYPVFSLAAGDTTSVKDLAIKDLIYNQQSYQGSAFPLKVLLEASQLKGQAFTLQLNTAEGLIAQKKLSINNANYYQSETFYIEPKEAGLQAYTLSLSQLKGEQNTVNNQQKFVVEVIDRKKKIALIAESPHPDVAALKAALESQELYDLKLYLAKDLTEAPSADFYILHEPSARTFNVLPLKQRPFLVLAAASTHYPYLTKNFGIGLQRQGANEEVLPVLNGDFTGFQLNEQERNALQDYPPLASPYGNLYQRQNVSTLLYKQVGAVKTQQPLLFFTQQAGQRQGYLMGVNLWRWRLQNYRAKQNFETFDGLWQKVVQYLTTQTVKQRFTVNVGSRYRGSEDIEFNARLLNPSLELTNRPEVSLQVKNQAGKTFNYTFSRSAQTYQLKIKGFPEGIYTYEASTQLGSESFSAKGALAVEDVNAERASATANYQVLSSLAKTTQGNFYTLAQKNELKQALMGNGDAQTEVYKESSLKSLLNYPWLLALLIILLSLEWALRKFWGNY